ncbi:MAG TPA: carbonic anhydrase [Patescibacteria group bacterium]|nr:carbonic anhydrase [Patescibacteria group bacterium]
MGKRLFEAMIEANHLALAGDSHAGLHPADFQDELPLVALTCVDARLNALLPQALGVPPEEFIWLRNAGNIITGSMSSTMRSLALACAVKGGKEVVIIGHTDCQVGKTTTMQLLDRFRELGVERHMLPDNLNEYFGIFSSDRQNVIKSVETARSSPLIGPKVPVQGLLIDIETGKLEWLVNGYEILGARVSPWTEVPRTAGQAIDALKPLTSFDFGEMKFPETKIGELVSTVAAEIAHRIHPPTTTAGAQSPSAANSPTPPSAPAGFTIGGLKVPENVLGDVASIIESEFERRVHSASGKIGQSGSPPKIPLPPPIRPRIQVRKPSK